MVSVSVVITVAPDNRLVVISAILIPKVFTITIAITMTFAHRYANRTYTDADLLRSGRNCTKNTHHGGYCYCVSNHCFAAPMNLNTGGCLTEATTDPDAFGDSVNNNQNDE
ncbi:MAG: hypothetical protein ACLQDM_06830 [Bradyrhizobium sp.]